MNRNSLSISAAMTPPTTEVTSMSRLSEAGPAHRAVAATSFTSPPPTQPAAKGTRPAANTATASISAPDQIHRDRARQDVRRMDGDQGEAEPVRNAPRFEVGQHGDRQ